MIFGWLLLPLILLTGLFLYFRNRIRQGSVGILPINPQTLLKPMPNGARVGDERSHALAVACIANARDLGGYLTKDGRMVQTGKIFRTGTLNLATKQDLAELNRLGLQTIFDLRSDREVAERPDRVPTGVNHQHLPIQAEDPARGTMGKLFFERSALTQMMADGYLETIDKRGERFGAVLSKMADPQNLPAIIHCTAGKDRAGMTAALLLGLLDVPRETIVADYALSNLAFDQLYADFKSSTGARLERAGIPFDDLRGLLVADPAWIEGVLDYIDREHRSVEQYLIKKGGMTAEQIEQIRENLLD